MEEVKYPNISMEIDSLKPVAKKPKISTDGQETADDVDRENQLEKGERF